MTFKEFKKEKQKIDDEKQRKYEEMRRARKEFDEKLAKERKEFNELMNRKKVSLEIISEIRKYAVGILTGNSLTSYTLKELIEKAQKDEQLQNNKELRGALEKMQTGKMEEILEAILIMGEVSTKYISEM